VASVERGDELDMAERVGSGRLRRGGLSAAARIGPGRLRAGRLAAAARIGRVRLARGPLAAAALRHVRLARGRLGLASGEASSGAAGDALEPGALGLTAALQVLA
jgi:hypothetical protein